MGYIEAYHARMIRNHNELLELVKNVIEKSPKTEAYYHKDPDRSISSIVFFDGEYINSVGFHEVPYRWSGPGFHEHGQGHSGGENASMPFDANDILSTFKPITTIRHRHDTTFKSKTEYLNWCSYLKKHETI